MSAFGIFTLGSVTWILAALAAYYKGESNAAIMCLIASVFYFIFGHLCNIYSKIEKLEGGAKARLKVLVDPM